MASSIRQQPSPQPTPKIQEEQENQAMAVTSSHVLNIENSTTNGELNEQDETDTVVNPNNDSNHSRVVNFNKVLLAVNYLCLFVGTVSSTLLNKFYFNHNGSSRWVSTLVQSAGFPLLIFPIYLPYYSFNSIERKPFSGFTRNLWVLSIFVGFMMGFNNLLYSWGSSYLPVSTFSLLLSCQMVFALIFCFLIVKQKFTFSNLNCVILLTLSAVLLALGSNHDKPKGLTKAKYFIGYFSGISAGLLFSLYLPIIERIYQRVTCYSMVIEMQLVMETAATVLATVGMAWDGGFSDMKAESLELFDLGTRAYWLTIFLIILAWQLCFMGTAGLIFLTTSLTGGICMTALMVVNVIAGVLAFKDEFSGLKAVSTVLCVWGFSSYLYSKWKEAKERERINHRSPSLETAEVASHRDDHHQNLP